MKKKLTDSEWRARRSIIWNTVIGIFWVTLALLHRWFVADPMEQCSVLLFAILHVLVHRIHVGR